MDENAIILFTCDEWHSHSSKDIIGIFNDEEAYNQYIIDMQNDRKLNKDDVKNLREYQQTQGKDMNYLIETFALNPKYSA